jgi:hypothetical protein
LCYPKRRNCQRGVRVSVKNAGLGIVLLSAAVLPLAAVAQGLNMLHPEGSFVEPATGMTYPVSVGDFKRVNIIKYNPDGTDESAGYNRIAPSAEISATIYIFRSPSLVSIGSPQAVIDGARAHLCESQFHAIEQEVMSAHPDAERLSEEPVSLTQEGTTFAGHKTTYKLSNADFFGRSQMSRSEAYVFCYAGGKWTIEYRIDYPIDYDASASISEFMRNLKWTISPPS